MKSMAKTTDNQLFDQLRASGLRKRVARDLSSALGSAKSSRPSKAAQSTIGELRSLLDELEDRALIRRPEHEGTEPSAARDA